MTEHTRHTSLGELCKPDRGGLIQTGPFGSQLHASDYTVAGTPVVMPANIADNRIDTSGIARVGDDHTNRLSRHRLRPGDVVYSRRGDITRRALVREEEAGWLCGTGCLLVRPGADVDPRWLSFWLGAPWTHEYLLQRAVGATMANLNTGILSGLPVGLPPLEEQRRIAGVLGALDDLADENLRQVERIHALSQTLYESFAARSSTKVKLGAVAQTNPDKVKPETEGSISYVDIASLSDGNMVSQATTWDQAPSRARRGAMVGDTLWSTVRPNRRGHAVLTKHIESLVVSTGIAVLRPHLVGPAELFAATDRQGFVDYLVSRAEGSAYPAVSASAFHEAEIADLAAVDREMFESAMWPLWRWVGELEHESHHLRRTRDELLPLLLSGRVRVREVAA